MKRLRPVLANGNAYEMSYATFVTFRDGFIVNYREYWNPIAFIAAMSGVQFHGAPCWYGGDRIDPAPLQLGVWGVMEQNSQISER
jgi:hypothetical protein